MSTRFWNWLLFCRWHWARRVAFRKLNVYLDDEKTDWSKLVVNRDKSWGFTK